MSNSYLDAVLISALGKKINISFKFNIEKENHIARNTTVFDTKSKKIDYDYDLTHKLTFEYSNKLTNLINPLKIDFEEKEKSALVINLKDKKYIIKHKSNIPTTHKYLFNILNPIDFKYEYVKFEDIDKYYSENLKILELNKNYANNNILNYIKEILFKNLDELLEENFEEIGLILHKYIYKVNNESDFQKILNENTGLMVNTFGTFLKRLANHFLYEEKIIDNFKEPLNNFEKQIDSFIKTDNNLLINDEIYSQIKNFFLHLKNKKEVKLELLEEKIQKDLNKRLYKFLKIITQEQIPLIDKKEENLALTFHKKSIFFVLNFLPKNKNLPFIVKKEEIEEIPSDSQEIEIDNQIYITNINNIKIFKNFSYEKNIKEFIKEIIEEELKNIALFKENFNYIKNNFINFLYPHSALKFLDLKRDIFPDLSKFNSNKNISIEEIIKDKVKLEIFKNTSFWEVIKYVLNKNNIPIPETNIIEFLPDTKEIKKEKPIIEINKENLGMKKFGYIPKILIDTKERKQKVISVFKTIKSFEDMNLFEKVIEKGNFIHILNEEILNKDFFENKAIICVFDKDGIPFAKLNLNIFQYLDLIEKHFIKIEKIVDEVKIADKEKYIVITNLFIKLKDFYSKLLEDSLNIATKQAYSFLEENNYIKIKNSFTNLDKKNYINLQIIFLEKLVNLNVLESNLKNIKDLIKRTNISPIEKNRLLDLFDNYKNIYYKLDDINKELIIIQKTNPDLKNEIENLIKGIIKEIVEIKKLIKKETNSFIHTVAILKNLYLIKQTDDMNKKIKILNEMYNNLFKSWALNCVGLSNEQFQDALNAILIQNKNNNKVINFFHDMGTGKTRLALFYSLLNSALNKNNKVVFAIQNKNADDIYEQLRDMLPSLTIFVNKNFRNRNYVNNVDYPFELIEHIDLNLINPNFAELFVNSNNLTKNQIVQDYPNKLQFFLEEYKNINLTDLTKELKKLKINKFDIKIEELIKDIEQPINEQLMRIDNTLSKTDFNEIRKIVYKNIIFITKFLNYLIDNNNILINEKNKHKILNKISKLKNLNENYIEYLLNSQNENNIYLLSKNVISSLIKTEKEEMDIKNINPQVQDVKTKNKIDNIKSDIIKFTSLDKEIISNLILDLYKKIDYSKMDKENFYLINIFKSEEILKIILKKVIENEGIEEKAIYDVINNISINQDDIIFQKNNFIKNYNVYLEMKTIKSDLIIQELIKLNEKIKNEKLNNLLKDRNIVQKFNAYVLSIIFYNLQNNKDFKFREKLEFFNNYLNIQNVNISIEIPLKETDELVYKIDTRKNSIVKLSKPFFKKNLIKDNSLTEKKEKIFFKNIKININKNNKTNFEIEFSSPYIVKNFVNYNSSNFFILKENKKMTFIVDESHKSKETKRKILKKNINLVQLTGTPINGTPYSLAEIDNPFLDKQKIREKSKIFQINGGITKINNYLIKVLFNINTLKERKELLNMFIDFIIKNPNKDIEYVKSLIETYFQENFIDFLLKNKINVAEIDFSAFITEGLEAISALFKKIENFSLIEITDDFIIKNLIKKRDLIEMPGISNPTITKLLDSVSSIKTQQNRTYNLLHLDALIQGKCSPNVVMDIQKNDFYKKDSIIELLEIYKNYKNLEKTKAIKEIKKSIKLFYLNFLENKDKKNLFDFFKTKIEDYFGIKVSYDEKDFLKYLTPKTTTLMDTIDKYFEDAIYLQKQIPQEKVDALDFIIKSIEIIEKESLNIIDIEDVITKYNITFENNFQTIVFDKKEFKPFFFYDIKKIFPEILKEKTFLEFNFLNRYDKTNIKTLLKVQPIKASEIFIDEKRDINDSVILYTKKNKELIFATLMFLENLYKQAKENPLKKLHYVLINISNNSLRNIFNQIDYEKLAKNNIYIKLTNPQKIYIDYNYSLPPDAKVAIIGNYTSLAEGFRFPKNPNIIFNSYPDNIATGLQASARAFFPKKVFNSNILLGCSPIDIKIDYTLDTKIKEKFEKEFEINPENVLSLINKYSSEKIGVTYNINKINSNEQKQQKKVSESFITSLKFIGAIVKGFNEEIPNNIIDSININFNETKNIEEKNEQNKSTKIKNKI